MPVCAEAAFTDFEDLTVDTEYLPGDSFQSNGISFNLLGIDSQQGGLLRISEAFGAVDVNRAGGTGLALHYAGLEIDVALSVEAEKISLFYGVFSSIDLLINGIPALTTNGLNPLDGSIIDGVSVTVVPGAGASNQGELILEGPISSLILGGSEVWIDNLTIIVPEPSTVALLLAAGFSLAISRRHRH